MILTKGSVQITIALLDGPPTHSLLPASTASGSLDEFGQADRGVLDPSALHSHLIRDILSSQNEGIASGCRIIERHIFDYDATTRRSVSTVENVSRTITECVLAGVHLINLSAALTGPGTRIGLQLEQALTFAAKKGTLVFVAVGCQEDLVGLSLASHQAVIPVVGYSKSGQPSSVAATSRSVARRGIGAPGEIVGRDTHGRFHTVSGSSFAVPFVVGTAALLWSLFPSATANELTFSLLRASRCRAAIAPPLLDAWESYEILKSIHNRGG